MVLVADKQAKEEAERELEILYPSIPDETLWASGIARRSPATVGAGLRRVAVSSASNQNRARVDGALKTCQHY